MRLICRFTLKERMKIAAHFPKNTVAIITSFAIIKTRLRWFSTLDVRGIKVIPIRSYTAESSRLKEVTVGETVLMKI